VLDIFYLDDQFKFELVKKNSFYVLASNGLFFYRKMKFFTSLTPVFLPAKKQSIGQLQAAKPFVMLNLPKKIPNTIFGQALSFFCEVFSKFGGSEAVVLIYWNSLTEEYDLRCPKQEVGIGYISSYEVGPNPPNCLRLGTIHSHGSMAAFHSGVDDKDEECDDGIHITIGTINSLPSISCSVVVSGERFEISEKDIFEYPNVGQHDLQWIKSVKKVAAVSYYGKNKAVAGKGNSKISSSDLGELPLGKCVPENYGQEG